MRPGIFSISGQDVALQQWESPPFRKVRTSMMTMAYPVTYIHSTGMNWSLIYEMVRDVD